MLGFFMANNKLEIRIMVIYRDRVFIIMIGLALLSCIINPLHLLPGFDIFHNLFIAIILSLGLSVFFLTKPNLKLPTNTLSWVLLFIVVLVQPFINNIPYMDSLLIPLGTLAITILLSIAVTGLDNKVAVIEAFLKVLIIAMLLTFLIQITQWYGIVLHIGSIAFTSISTGRIDGNFLQPNQAAFMYALSIGALIYFYNNNSHRNIKVLIIALSFIFACGVAFTLSRAGLIMCMGAILAYAIFYKQELKVKVQQALLFLGTFFSGYYLGVYLYKFVKTIKFDGSSSAVQRFSEGSLYMRESLQRQAWDLFTNNPISGVGWGNFTSSSIDQASNLGWFAFSSHSHFFLSQIASELGILGLLTLIPIAWIILKHLRLEKSNFDTLVYLFIGIILVYACSEFPFWYLRFLFIFVIFVSLLESPVIEINQNKNKIFASISIGLFLASVFFWTQYLTVYKTFQMLGNRDLNDSDVTEIYDNFSVPFGYSNFKELLLFRFIPINATDIDSKIALGNRVFSTEISKLLLFRQGQLLAIKGSESESLSLFKASCAIDWSGNCDNVAENLEELSIEQPSIYTKINDEFEVWVEEFDPVKNR